MALLKRILLVVLLGGSLAAQVTRPERRVERNVIVSERDPKAQIRLPQAAHYAGADGWVLYGVANCELHAFVETDRQNNVQRLYWVQFEGYIPEKPSLKYDYDSPRHTTIGGLDFFVDTWTRANDAQTRAGSDREHIETMIRAKGYKMPGGMMYVRLVHLVDEQKRKELMIIYGEDLAATGFSAAELQKGGKAYEQWPGIEKGLVERAENKITIAETGKP